MESNINRYKEIIRNPLKEKRIETFIPKPTEEDYNRGFIRRYFIQKTNDKGSPIFEISQSQKNKFVNNPLYSYCAVKWRIRGPKETVYNETGNITEKSVSESNRIAIKISSENIPNLKLYLPNLLQFYKS
jgi:hypothetical protein